jgi:uncharacterized protein YutE (UPF0331/DUF86 family)
MTPTLIRSSVVAERVAWVRQMLSQARGLPLASLEIFLEDSRNAGAAESYLRRSIEALLDIGRHILAKGFAIAVSEYKEIGTRLVEKRVLNAEEGVLMRRIAGYRNRMVHFYNEVTTKELYLLTTQNIHDIDRICDAMVHWMREHPEMIDHRI